MYIISGHKNHAVTVLKQKCLAGLIFSFIPRNELCSRLITLSVVCAQFREFGELARIKDERSKCYMLMRHWKVIRERPEVDRAFPLETAALFAESTRRYDIVKAQDRIRWWGYRKMSGRAIKFLKTSKS